LVCRIFNDVVSAAEVVECGIPYERMILFCEMKRIV
jgi:hypothetical protein